MKTFLLLTFLFCHFNQCWSQVILIDPGHGGDEFGATGFLDNNKNRKVFEKDLALRLAIKVKDALLKSKAQVYLTRSFDRTISLADRADLAEKIKADLFISIHFNSSLDRNSHGHEIYYLDNSQEQAVKKVERTENEMPKGVDQVVNQILIDLVISQTVKTSTVLARKIQEHTKGSLKKFAMVDRGIKPGLFYVLALSKRPGVLLEVGFVSNSPELKKMNQEDFLNSYAASVASGIVNYWKSKKI